MIKQNSKLREIFFYLFFGGLTTITNIIVYTVCTRFILKSVVISNMIAWFLSVLFAFITNRKFVFNSSATTKKQKLQECGKFFMGRFGTGVFDILAMAFSVNILHLNDIIMKISINIVVIILNYLISKLLIFKNKAHSQDIHK